MPPGYHKEWHIGVRVRTSKKLVAFISGVPITLHVRDKLSMSRILCSNCHVILCLQACPYVRDQLPVCA
jgi:Myristoyl-CoA:protein N-myristoyltransferase, N-terminal domain